MEPRRRFDASQGPRIIGPQDGKTVDLDRGRPVGDDIVAQAGDLARLCRQRGLRYPLGD
jgi:hypothetical protein